MLGGVVIGFKAKVDDAIRDIGKLNKKLGGVDKAARGAGGGMSKWAKAATAGVAAVAGVAGVAAHEFVDMAKAAYEDKQAQDKMVRTLDRVKGVTTKAAEATGAWVDRMELLTLISDTDLRNALARLTPVTEDLTEAQNLAALAADAAVASGKPYATVVEAMAKAAGGNTAALKKLFPQLDAGPDKVLTMAEAVDQLKGSYDGAAKAAADNDLFGRLSTAFGQIQEAVGGIALPALENLADWFADKKNVKVVEEWIGKLAEWATSVGTDFADKVKSFVDYLKSPEGKKAIADFSTNVRNLGTTLGQLAGYIDDIATALANLKKYTDWLPSNVIIKMLTGGFGDTAAAAGRGAAASGLMPGGGSPPPGNSRSKNAPTLSVVINNPRPEKASSSIAAAQRAARWQDNW